MHTPWNTQSECHVDNWQWHTSRFNWGNGGHARLSSQFKNNLELVFNNLNYLNFSSFWFWIAFFATCVSYNKNFLQFYLGCKGIFFKYGNAVFMFKKCATAQLTVDNHARCAITCAYIQVNVDFLVFRADALCYLWKIRKQNAVLLPKNWFVTIRNLDTRYFITGL